MTPRQRWAWFTDQPLWQRIVVAGLPALIVVLLIVGHLVSGGHHPPSAEYTRARAECDADPLVARAALLKDEHPGDTGYYNLWVDGLNSCLASKYGIRPQDVPQHQP